jgi:DNA-binding PadR family transcriptional regulator
MCCDYRTEPSLWLRRIKYVGDIFPLMPEARAVQDSGIARDLTAFQQNILAILSDEPMYGLAIKRELESYYDSEVNHGRLYPNLDDLVEAGLVEKSERDKRTNDYTLTDEGYEAVVDKLDWTLGKFVTDDDRAETVRDLIDSQR